MTLILLNLQENSSFQEWFLVFLDFLLYGFIIFLKVFYNCTRCFQGLIQARLTLAWFPALNPYLQPYFTIMWYVELITKDFKKFIPLIFGIDVTPIVVYFFLGYVSLFLDEFIKYLENL